MVKNTSQQRDNKNKQSLKNAQVQELVKDHQKLCSNQYQREVGYPNIWFIQILPHSYCTLDSTYLDRAKRMVENLLIVTKRTFSHLFDHAYISCYICMRILNCKGIL